MSRYILSLVATVILLLVSSCMKNDIKAEKLLSDSVTAYKALNTYKSEGVITSTIETGAGNVTQEITFALLLKKPNLYRITWSQKSSNVPDVQNGAVWSDGTQRYLYISGVSAYCPLPDDATALGAATGISGGAAATVPFLFLAVPQMVENSFSRLTHPKILESQQIDGEDCHVISSPSTISKEETLWISKSSGLMRKCSRSLEAPATGRKIPEMSEEQIEETIRAMGMEVTEQSKMEYRAMMEAMMKTSMKGSNTETHTTITFPELNPDDFRFVCPEGTKLHKSFDDMMLAARQSKDKTIRPDAIETPPDDQGIGQPDNTGVLTTTPVQEGTTGHQEKALHSSCMNNLKQCGLVYKMFAGESPKGWAPPLSPRPGYLMWQKEVVYPEYLTDPTILVCPADNEKRQSLEAIAEYEDKAVFSFANSTYWYLGYAIPDDKTGLAFAEAYREQVERGGAFLDDLKDGDGKPIYRLCEGVERFFITDINDTQASWKIQSKLPVFIERPGAHGDSIAVLYIDGHVESLTYPGDFPASRIFIEALQGLEALRQP